MLRWVPGIAGTDYRMVASALIFKLLIMIFLIFIIVLVRNHNIQAAGKMQYLIGPSIWDVGK